MSGWEQQGQGSTGHPTTSPATHRLLLLFGAGGAVVIAVLVALLFVLPLDLPFTQVPATITPKVAVDGHVVRVTGTTNLPDGALINYFFLPEVGQGQVTDEHGGTTEVHGNKYEVTADLSDWPSGKVTVYNEFSVAYYGGNEQPQNVIDVFGSQGEHMSGPQVYVDSPGDPKRLFVSVPFQLPT